MSAFDSFCEFQDLDRESGDTFAQFCKDGSGYEPYLLTWDEVEKLWEQYAP